MHRITGNYPAHLLKDIQHLDLLSGASFFAVKYVAKIILRLAKVMVGRMRKSVFFILLQINGNISFATFLCPLSLLTVEYVFYM